MNRQYIGARYVPKFADPVEWDKLKSYEGLTIVTYAGTSYTSKKPVPVGIELNNTEYWVVTGNYNEQVESYRQETALLKNNVDILNKISSFVTPERYGAVGDGITNDTDAVQKAVNSGCDVVLKNKYLINKPINITKEICIYGCVNSQIEMMDGVTISRLFYAENVTNVTISGVRLHGHALRNTDDETGLAGITIIKGRNININMCHFTGFNKNIEFTECVNVTVENNVIEDGIETLNKINGYGVLIEGGHNLSIINNIINVERHGVYLNECDDVLVLKNIITGQTDDKASYSHYEGNVKIDGATNIEIGENIISGNYYGIGILNGFSSNKPYGVKKCNIHDNTIRDCIGNGGFSRGLIDCVEETLIEDVTINNNTLSFNSRVNSVRGINLERGNWKNLIITNNKFINCIEGIRYEVDCYATIDGNIANNCETGYNFSLGQFHASGCCNYFMNCEYPVLGNVGTMRYLNMPNGFVDLQNTESQLTTSVVDCTVKKDYIVITDSPITVSEIKGGCNGQIVNLIANGAGALTIPVQFTGGNLDKTLGRFVSESVAVITLIKIDSDWKELSRHSYN